MGNGSVGSIQAVCAFISKLSFVTKHPLTQNVNFPFLTRYDSTPLTNPHEHTGYSTTIRLRHLLFSSFLSISAFLVVALLDHTPPHRCFQPSPSNDDLRTARDMPPPGGFEPVKYKRNLPFRGPSGVMILAGVTAICTWGFYRYGQATRERL